MSVEIALNSINLQKSEKIQLGMKELMLVLLVAGSGFFVDIYDVVLFSVVRVPSLISLGLTKAQMFSAGVFLLNIQLAGMIIGSFFWGTLGDKKGRKASLFGSILLYSLATFFNGFVTSLPMYAFLRFLAGLGLAGEIGAAVTIAAEVSPAKHRGYAVSAVRCLGSAGGLLACVLGDRLPWRLAYISAGLVGLVLLLARMSLKESSIFINMLEDPGAKRGSIKLFLQKERFLRLLRCILANIPFWFVFGVIISFAPEICNAKSGMGIVTVAAAGFYFSCGTIIGDLLSGAFSQWLRSRKLAIFTFLFLSIITTVIVCCSPVKYYAWLCLPLGMCIAYHVVINTATTEQFGTNIRATAATLSPNFVRASAIPVISLFSYLSTIYGALNGSLIVGIFCFTLALIAIIPMEETFAKDLNFLEN